MGNLVLNAANALSGLSRAVLQGLGQRAINWLTSEDVEGPRRTELALQTSTEGAPIPIVYGRMRVTGQVIWAARFKESSQSQSTGGKSGGEQTSYSYSVSFAVGLCEGPISGIGRVWANGTLVDLSSLTYSLHLGGDTQSVDPLIEAIEGSVSAPAYRGMAYIVFEDFPLDEFGQRIPSLSFEVIGGTDSISNTDMEYLINGVCLIPALGEFTYSDTETLRETYPGVEVSENRHSSRAATDLDAALDDLQSRLPQCRSVALVTSWFGDDLRCGACQLKPGVESSDKETRPLTWHVAGLERGEAHLVSQIDGSPVYGGTPSDETIIAAIKALKARGFDVTLYPFILMDVPSGNGLADPYAAAEQAVFPWCGRITCHPAARQSGSVDKTTSAAAQVDNFFGASTASDFEISGETVSYGGAEDWRFNRFILHHAALAAAAGGVESMIIGSEMRGLTTIRSGQDVYPAVPKLVSLANEVRLLVGANTKISYAADWSEYFGHAPSDGSGDRYFHLDPLWASNDIYYIGIDWYAPLADWRDGESHLDALAGFNSIYDPDYLTAQVEGAEGDDWFYASDADRAAQNRTDISDGAYGEPWVWRYKDLRSWWSNAHFNREAGVRAATATDWVPESKPIRFVELGCPAVDKGANQPNVFIDPKSSESFAPYFSAGTRDDLIQRRFIEALIGYWRIDAGNDPISSVYGDVMLEMGYSHVWTWDARPYPQFPVLEDVWSDGPNWNLGHWLTGRAGQSSLSVIVADIASRGGVTDLDVSVLDGLLAGYIIDRPQRARDLLEELGTVFGFDLIDGATGPKVVLSQTTSSARLLPEDLLVSTAGDFGPKLYRTPFDERLTEVRLNVVADDGNYQPMQVGALGLDNAVNGVAGFGLSVLADRDLAAHWAQNVLTRINAADMSAKVVLPPSVSDLEVGDVVQFDHLGEDRIWRIEALDGLRTRHAELSSIGDGFLSISGPLPTGNSDEFATYSRPIFHALDIPLGIDETSVRDGLIVYAMSTPWPNSVDVYAGITTDSAEQRISLTSPATLGVLSETLEPGHESRWDFANSVKVQLYFGSLDTVDKISVQAGQRLVAVETNEGWEVLTYKTAELREDGSYLLTGLLRGLGGSPTLGAAAGAAVVLLNDVGALAGVSWAERESPIEMIAVQSGKAITDSSARSASIAYNSVDYRPLSPVHLQSRWDSGDLRLQWIRRDRIGADPWQGEDIPMCEASERYRLRVFDEMGTELLSEDTETKSFSIEASSLSALLPDGVETAGFSIAQVSVHYGEGLSNSASLDPTKYG